MGSWQPQQQGLRELLILLQDAARPDNQDQALMQQRLASFNEIPDYNSYLVYILTRMPHEDSYTRAIAGLTLKNNIKAFFNSIQLSVLDYIKACCIEALEHPDPDVSVRKTVGSVVAAIVTGGQAHNWPQILQVLVNNLDSSDPVTVELAMDTLRKVCEDAARDLDQEMEGVRPLNYMIPKLISFFYNPDSKLRIQAIAATSQFVMLGTQALLVNMESYLAGLFACAFDKQSEIRQEVARSLVMVLEACPDKLEPSLPSVFDYMIQCTKDDDEPVALEACDFWIQFCSVQAIANRLVPYLDRVVPALLDRMVYSETDLLMMGSADMDTNVPDDEQDIRPRFYKGKTRFGGSSGKENTRDGDDKAQQAAGADQDGEETEDDEDLDDDEEDLDDEEFFSEWTLRKCSAAALDELSNTYNGHVVSALLPLLPNKMFSQDWKVRESGVLALGAAAEGGMDDFSAHLPEIMPHLLSSLNDNQPLIRSITCWALGRFSRWCVEQAASPEGRAAFFEPVLFSLLQRVLDKNKRVQEAACSAFATLEEEATVELIPYLEPILINLTTAFNMYQHKNLLILYDALGTLAESVGSALNQPRCLQLMMPPLITRWNELSDQDKNLFPLLECLSSVTAALGTGFAPFAEPVFTRCVKLIAYTLQQIFLADQNPEEHDPPDVEFMVVALDLLSGLVQGLDHLVEPLIAKSEPPLLSLVAVCVHDPVTEVLQATYALIGDIAIACFEQLRGYLGPILPELIDQINADAHLVSVSNNAIWAAGEIALRWGNDMQPYVDALLQRLIPLLLDPNLQSSLQENAMVTVGRLGYACPDKVAVHLSQFLKPWLNKSFTMRENDEKDTAFQGLCEMIKKNPHGVANDFTLLLETIAQWQKPSPPLLKSFSEILSGYRNLLSPEQWQQAWKILSADAQQALSRRYAL